MEEELEIFKRKLLYRASYRGTKEMDILLKSFVESNIDTFDHEQLKDLEKFLKFEDQTILNYYYYNNIDHDIDKNRISNIFKKFKI